MRKRFEPQNKLDATPIPEVEIDGKSRHELPQLLAGLQYIFVTPGLNEEVLSILEEQILGGKQATGRLGMSLWEILVLGSVRLNLDVDYDMLYDLSNNHKTLRGILGVDTQGVFERGAYYPLQTLKDNVGLLDEATLKRISELVVKAGHELKKNESGGEIELHLKSDTYAVESNIHFPTDLNLLWDSARKCLDVIDHIYEYIPLRGWRKRKYWRNQVKKYYLRCANIHQKKGKNYQQRLKSCTKQYLEKCREMSRRLIESRVELLAGGLPPFVLEGLMVALTYYHEMLDKLANLVERRILQDEKIPHQDKIFSIFEIHVEWIQKGKYHKQVELGHNVLITSDQFHFIVDHEVVVGQSDKALPIPLSQRLQGRFGTGYLLKSISFDRGFYSYLAKKALQGFFAEVIMPKPGKKTVSQEAEENRPSFIHLRHAHSAVESNINELEHSGVNKVPDKSLEGFKRYVALGVLAYNLKRLGRLVMAQEILPTVVRPGKERKAAA